MTRRSFFAAVAGALTGALTARTVRADSFAVRGGQKGRIRLIGNRPHQSLWVKCELVPNTGRQMIVGTRKALWRTRPNKILVYRVTNIKGA